MVGPRVSGPAVTVAPGEVTSGAWEAARVAALRSFGVLDTAAEAVFDELTGLAAELCGTPMALVSLVDTDRQWFKSRLGLDLCETSREVSFCAHALAGPEVFVVNDAQLDPRFAGNPLVTGDPRLRFYAGAPLVTDEGHALGTLCVLDTVPRVLSSAQTRQLRVLARQVLSQLELRRQADALASEVAARAVDQAALRDSQRLLDGVLAHTDVVVYAKDLDGRFLLANPALHQLLRADDGDVLGRRDHDLFPPAAAQQFRAHDLQVAASGVRDTFAEQLPHPDGTVHGYLSTKFPLRDDTGQVYAVAGVSTDVTELSEERAAHAEAEQRWKALVEHSPVAVAVIGADACFAYANPHAVALYGVASAEGLIGSPALGFVRAGDEADTAALFGALLHGGAPVVSHRWTLRRADGALLVTEVNAAAVTYRGKPAVQVELRDVSTQAAAEAALRDSEQRFRTLFECSPVGTAECLPDGAIQAVNPRLCAMLGYPPAELIGRHSREFLADAEQTRRHDEDLAALTGGVSSYFCERVYRRKDGSLLPVLVGVGVYRDEAGQPARVLATLVDLSERDAAEAALRAARDDLADRQVFTDTLLESIDVGVLACDPEGRMTVANAALRRFAGEEEPHSTGGAGLPAPLHDTDGSALPAPQQPLARVIAEGQLHGVDGLIAVAGKPPVHVVWSGRLLTGPDGRPLGAVVAINDVTAARSQTAALQASEARFRAAFSHDPAGLAVVRRDGPALQVNPALCRITGRSQAQLLALPNLLTLAAPDDQDTLRALARQALDHPGTTVTAELPLLRADGTALWTRLTLTELGTDDRGPHGSLLLQVEDVTERRTEEQRLTRQAMYDNLTDLPNRAMLLDRATIALARLARRPDHGMLAALFCDLDGFKAINDTHGHAAGDHVLIEVARRLTDVMRPTDTVARLGGDEFIVLCENLPDHHQTERIAARLRVTVAEPVPWHGHQLEVTASVGIAYGRPTMTAAELLRTADAAMYDAKKAHHAPDGITQ